MKAKATSKIYLPMAALILAAFSIPAAAQAPVPFKGVFKGNDAVNAPTITTSGGGTGTLLQDFSFTEQATLSSATSGTGSAHWEAANGDSIDSTFIASADMSTGSLGYITVTEIHTITAGKGRFAGGQGNFIAERTHIVDPSADGTHVIFGSFHGAMTLPPPAQ